jgi:hypothetical protein
LVLRWLTAERNDTSPQNYLPAREAFAAHQIGYNIKPAFPFSPGLKSKCIEFQRRSSEKPPRIFFEESRSDDHQSWLRKVQL